MPSTNDLRSYLDQARAQGQKLADPDVIKSTVEPYLQRAKGAASLAADRAEGLYASARNDERVGKYVQTAESMAGALVETVNTRLVQPVLSRTGMNPPQRPAGRSTDSATAERTDSGTGATG